MVKLQYLLTVEINKSRLINCLNLVDFKVHNLRVVLYYTYYPFIREFNWFALVLYNWLLVIIWDQHRFKIFIESFFGMLKSLQKNIATFPFRLICINLQTLSSAVKLLNYKIIRPNLIRGQPLLLRPELHLDFLLKLNRQIASHGNPIRRR